jgi:TolB-like protein/tetratricopeptide (TPR) repeat protein
VKSPGERYQRLDDFLVDLRALRKQTESRAETMVRPRARSRKPRIAMAIAAAVVIVAVGIPIMRSIFFNPTGAIDSIAVLPLENLSRDPAQEYFADGMTESLITDLANIGALKVISRTSVMRFKDTKEPLPKIARELGVDAVIEGSVLVVGDRVRITAQLIEAATDRHIWAESYERDLRDVLSLQQEVARGIGKAIKVALTPAETATLTKAVQVDPKVHDLYLRGRYHWNKRTAADLEKSIEYFEKAIAMDPRFALAYVAAADAYLVVGNWGYRNPREMFALAKQYAEKALEIDGQLSQPYAVLAGVEEYINFNWREAERLYEQAIELNQNNATAHQWHAEFLSARGRQEEALAEIDKSLAIDPLSLIANQNRAVVLLREKRYDEALAQCQRTLDLDKEFRSVHMIAAYCYAAMARFPDFVAELQEAIARDENGRRYADEAGRIFSQAGIEGLTRWMIENIDEVSGTPYDSPYVKAELHAQLGEKDQAIEWMKKAVEVRSPGVVTWKVDPAFDALRNDPRFMTVIREAGLE